jgi:hypothetical protein
MFYITNSLATQSSVIKWVGSLEQCDAPKQHNYYCFVWSNALEIPPGFSKANMYSTTNLPTRAPTATFKTSMVI